MKDMKAITLTQGQMTAARRSSPIPQLQCVGGSAQYSNMQPRVVQCVQTGHDGYDAQWQCKAELDDAVQFGTVNVNCEGFQYADDPYVLRGSCGLEYSLEYTRKGQQEKAPGGGGYTAPSYQPYNAVRHGEGSSFLGTVFSFLALVFCIYVGLRCCFGTTPSAAAGAPGTYGAPPPAGSYGTSFGGAYGNGLYPSAPPMASYAAPAAPQPGFWSGFTAGGLLGYLFRPRPHYYGTPYGTPFAPMTPTYGGATFMPTPSAAPSGGSTRTSTGFGGTKRR